MNDGDLARTYAAHTGSGLPPGAARYDRAIADLACWVLDADHVDAVFARAVEELRVLCGASRSYLFEFDADGDAWRLRCAAGWPQTGVEAIRIVPHDAARGPALQALPLFRYGGAGPHDCEWSRLAAETGAPHGLHARIQGVRGELFGVVGVCTREAHELSEAEQYLLRRIAEVLSRALRRFDVPAPAHGTSPAAQPGRFERPEAGEAAAADALADRPPTRAAHDHAQRQARESEARMRFILQATRIGTWDWDVQSNAVTWSDNMEELHGRSPGSFDGTLESALCDVHPEDRTALQSAIAESMTGSGDYHIEYRIVTHDGRIRWLEAKGQIVRDDAGRVARMAGICMDVTDRREAEDALRISENMLRVQTEELATAHRQKDHFLAMLAHELRNPLAPISNAVQLLKIQTPEQREQTFGWAIDVIDRQVWLLSRLVDDLLDIARITRGRIELKTQQVDLKDVARIAVETASVWFAMKNQVFETDYQAQPLPVQADPTRIIQAVSNVLNNASKFTPEHGTVSMRVMEQDGQAVLQVKDSGIGIAGELLPHVFEPFTQADRSLDRRKGGLGLGLSLVKRLVEMHGGSVAASSAGMGRGSTFTLRLPLATDGAGRGEAALQLQPRDPGGRPLRVLLVDDNRQATDAMALLLETLEHAVSVAYNGPDALRVAETFEPDIVFLDIGLPLMDGYEVAEKLRRRFGTDITLIALTGYAPQDGRNGHSEHHFDEYFLKPLSLDKLSALLIRQSGAAH